MFDRFTERGRRVVSLAESEARRLGSETIGSAHLLLGVLREDGNAGLGALAARGLTLECVRARVTGQRAVEPRAGATGTDQLLFDDSAKRTLELALRRALASRQGRVTSEHILLGVALEREGLGAQILREAGFEKDHAVEELMPDVVLTESQRRWPSGLGSSPHYIARWQGPPSWEYRVERWPAGSLAGRLDELNALFGAEGWELAGTVPAGDEVELVFKRRAAPRRAARRDVG